MSVPTVKPTGRLVTFGEDEIIVSKTDVKGRITYANDVFQRVSGYTEEELMGTPHNILRHPAMPRCVFKLLWDTIQSGKWKSSPTCSTWRRTETNTGSLPT